MKHIINKKTEKMYCGKKLPSITLVMHHDRPLCPICKEKVLEEIQEKAIFKLAMSPTPASNSIME